MSKLSAVNSRPCRRAILRAWMTAAAVAGAAFGARAQDSVHLPVPYMAQPDDQTCLPTCLTMTLHFLGRESLTTDTVQRLHKRTQYERYNLPDILKDYDLHGLPSWLEYAWTPDTVKAELRAGRPVILGLDVGRHGHFVLAVGYTADGKVILNDPSSGLGRDFGGPNSVADWSQLNWRNGIIVRTEPFPEPPGAVSGTMTKIDFSERMTAGEYTTVTVEVKNNGRAPWPAGVVLAAVDAYSSPTRERQSQFAALPAPDAPKNVWMSASRVAAPDKPRLAPGETALFTFFVRAPQVNTTQVFRENFNLLDSTGRWFSDHWRTGPSNRQISMRIAVDPPLTWKLPLIEETKNGRPSLTWQTKGARVEPFSGDAVTSAAPVGIPALRLRSPDQRNCVAWVGDPKGADYKAEAWIYCDYRPQDNPRGFDRVGLFVRDNGHHAGVSKGEIEIGGCIAMAYDSDDGKLRAGNIYSGYLEDFRPKGQTHTITSSGWHRFAIRCTGSKVFFELDGAPFHETDIDRSSLLRGLYKSGDCGVFCSSDFASPADRRGVKFAGFRVEP